MPFTAEQFFEVFARYNQSVFPMQVGLVLAASLTVFLAIFHKPFFDEIISGALVFLWLWAGIVYHLMFFANINSGAYLFGAAFIAQGALFFYEGIVKKRLRFRLEPDLYGVLSAFLIVYALLVYPVVGTALGRVFPSSPTFGAPCPMVIFTFGLLVLTDRKFAHYLLIVPFLWAVVGTTAAWHFGVAEDLGLAAAALVATFFIGRRDFRRREEVFL